MKSLVHSHELADDPFQFHGHRKESEEYRDTIRQAKKHRQQVLPYSDSRRLIDAEDLGVIISAKEYGAEIAQRELKAREAKARELAAN
jgi:hypothetical protein